MQPEAMVVTEVEVVVEATGRGGGGAAGALVNCGTSTNVLLASSKVPTQ